MLALVCACACAYARTGDWEVKYESTDVTGTASPMPMGASVLLNVVAIGPVLGLTAIPEASGFRLQGADGRIWHWENGAGSLTSDAQMLPLVVPGFQEGGMLYLDPESIAEVSGVPVSIDQSTKEIVFRRQGVAASNETSNQSLSDGWQTFTIAKPHSALKATSSIPVATGISERLPATRDRLNLGLGIGYVQGADFGMEVTGSGRLAGGDLSMSAIVTKGELGTRLRSSHLLWLDRTGGTGIEAGDMYSETWGLVQGIRCMWNAGPNRWPSVSLNLNTHKTENPQGMLSYLDEFKVADGITIRGEVGTDKSRYLNLRYDKYPLQVFAYRRDLSRDLGESEGVFGALSLSRSVSLYYGMTSSTDEWDRKSTFRNTGLRLPLFKRWSLILGETSSDNGSTATSTRSAGVTIPITNKVHAYVRYQKNAWDATTIAGSLLNIQGETDSLLTSLSLFASPRVHLDYQRNRLVQEGRTANYEQLVTDYTVSPKTSIQAISGFPNILDSNLLRIRLNHRLENNMSLVVDYGRLSPYQSKDDVFGKRGFMVMLRKTWPMYVPAKGGRVCGTVTDRLGNPVPNIAVEMGTYIAVSDKDGRFQFSATPPGKYRIAVADKSVPADHRVETSVQEISVDRDTEQQIDFRLVPFGSITGFVYMDRNENNVYDDGEGIQDIAVYANDQVTATDRNGRFSFFNLDPGQYTVRVAAEFLDKKYVVQGNAALDVELQPKGSISDIEFKLDIRKKPVIFTALE